MKKLILLQPAASKQKLDAVFALCAEYNSLNPDSLFRYITVAKTIIKKTDLQDVAQASYFQIIYLNRKGKTDSAAILLTGLLSSKVVQENELLLLKFKMSKTGNLVRNNKMKEALETALQMLHEAEKINSVEFQMNAQSQVGWVYMELEQYRNALKWFFKTLETARRNNFDGVPANLYSNIAAVYNSLKMNDSATIFITRAIAISKQQQDLTFLCNCCYIYSDICTDIGDIKKAEALLKEGVEIRKKIGDPFYLVSDLAQLGKFYASTQQPDKGIAAIKEGISIAEENNVKGKLIFLNNTLAENYKVANDLQHYSQTLNTIITLKDSLYIQNSAEAISELQTKYEVQKKENTIIQQRLDLVQKNYWMFGSLALLFFGIVLWWVVFAFAKHDYRT